MTELQVTHTNDLASLALTNHALHNLAIPHIYARFDIVWPDAHNTAEPRTGVDALTYGLATLVMGEEVFANSQRQLGLIDSRYCESCICDHCQIVKSEMARAAPSSRSLRRGNYFSRFTRKFSLGNGPPDWVQEYLITKEAGKMLGTLVALSVARMPNLETFIWDMPTGILRDVWNSLAALGDCGTSRLEKIWIRFHDNRETFSEGTPQPIPIPQPTQNQIGTTATTSTQPQTQDSTSTQVPTLLQNSYRRTEHPNFSILSPLRSLNVLEIDEPAYLDEISVLIEKSLKTLRELRIGLASTASVSGWASLDSEVASPDTIAGGVLGLMMSKIYNPNLAFRPKRSYLPVAELLASRPETSDAEAPPELSAFTSDLLPASSQPSIGSLEPIVGPTLIESEDITISGSGFIGLPLTTEASSSKHSPKDEKVEDYGKSKSENPTEGVVTSDVATPKRLQLETMEMERIVIDVKIIQESIDWSTITSLTLLQCGRHEELWKALRVAYTPRSISFTKQLLNPSLTANYKLGLKRIHTDSVSPALIYFLKETLSPDSLQCMFLQDGREYKSPVTIESIFRGPLRRHRGSLTKVMIDSAIGKPDNTRNLKRKKWIVKREFLAFITSGKMKCLKELAISVEYKDWVREHFGSESAPYLISLTAFLYSKATSDSSSSLTLCALYCRPRLWKSAKCERASPTTCRYRSHSA